MSESLIETAVRRAREADERAQSVDDPEQAAFFRGVASAYRSIVDDAGVEEGSR
ncbi:hypothetical protein [Halarchaeum nitratireducens]|uniref:Uncharacterized protein n=1 Tax=Halarchaeum nitratireducens TaxID=489913 RepID=A0A830GD80_9EURY|nr:MULTISPECIES: hypothetical protein [Halarchaeum]MBP2251151.1 hypothetical protein [Halarchaeum solikamskense]GGN18659.1 hypothetical protein GCM10009021_19640 [Halarchaeum nitratireducens]